MNIISTAAALLIVFVSGFHQGEVPLTETVYFDITGASLKTGTVTCNNRQLARMGNSLERTWQNPKPEPILDCNIKLTLKIGSCLETMASQFSMLNEMSLDYKGKCKSGIRLLCYRGINYTTHRIETECDLAVSTYKK